MSQEMIAVCIRCMVYHNIGNFTHYKVKSKIAHEFFMWHKGHPLRIIGDDGGWDVVLGRMIEDGYQNTMRGKSE